MTLALLVFLSDALITGLSAREWQALQAKRWSAVAWDGLLALIIGINAMGFVEQRWWMLVPSTLGSMTGMAVVIWRTR